MTPPRIPFVHNIVMANVLFAAAYLGIDSCPIEGFTKDKVESILSDTYHLYDPEHFGVACITAACPQSICMASPGWNSRGT